MWDDQELGETGMGKTRGRSLSVYITEKTKYNKDENKYEPTGKFSVSVTSSDTVDGVTTSKGTSKETETFADAEKLVETFLAS